MPAAAISIAEDEGEPRKQKKKKKKTKRETETERGEQKKKTFLELGMGDGNNKTGCVEEWLATAIPPPTSSASVRRKNLFHKNKHTCMCMRMCNCTYWTYKYETN